MALRIGWRFITGLGERALESLRSARVGGPFESIEEVVRRAGLGRMEALHLARAGALEAFEPGRRAAAWEALRAAGDTLPLAPAGHLPFAVRELEGAELIFADYLATGICVHGHPLQHLRPRLRAAGITGSTSLAEVAHGQAIVVAGLVVVRQHPQTSKGTVFLLLEDEGGFVNVIVPPQLYQKHRETVRHSPFLIIEGRLERSGAVVNVIGRRFRRLEMPALSHHSHDFR